MSTNPPYPDQQLVIPNTAAYRVQEATFGNDTSFTSTMMTTIQSLAYQQNMAMKKWNDDGRKGAMPGIGPPANATPEQLSLFGVQPPGHPFWTEETLRRAHQRYPGWDLAPYRAALAEGRRRATAS